MNAYYEFARVTAGFLGFTSLVGVIWFGGVLPGVDFGGGLILGLTSLAAALIPKRQLSHATVFRVMITLCVAGALAGMALVASNFSPPYPIEWDVIVINLLNVGALIVMAAKARGDIGRAQREQSG